MSVELTTKKNLITSFDLLRYILMSLFLFNLQGCLWMMTSTKDVANDSRYWGGFKPGAEYQLITDIYINKKYGNLLPETMYNNYVTKAYPWPTSFVEYLKDPDKYPDLKILNKGTVIRCEQILFIDNDVRSLIDIRGVVLNDIYRNNIFSMRFLSMGANDSPEFNVRCRMPNPVYLKPLP